MLRLFILIALSALAISRHARSEDLTLEGCSSSQGVVIPHRDFSPKTDGLRKKILVIGQIHGDEPQAGELAAIWLKRLEGITPSNHWRIIPLLNPDGTTQKTRFNQNKVDLNRNFPTKDWDEHALSDWKEKHKSDPRRYPGEKAASEIETRCVMKHIEDFKPDLVVSIHTPYGLFDFDGPENKKIKTPLLPWKRLGTFPGSLGRYLWDERGVPVLTIELLPNSLINHEKGFTQFQDYLSNLI
jgi:hypothetical protein